MICAVDVERRRTAGQAVKFWLTRRPETRRGIVLDGLGTALAFIIAGLVIQAFDRDGLVAYLIAGWQLVAIPVRLFLLGRNPRPPGPEPRLW